MVAIIGLPSSVPPHIVFINYPWCYVQNVKEEKNSAVGISLLVEYIYYIARCQKGHSYT